MLLRTVRTLEIRIASPRRRDQIILAYASHACLEDAERQLKTLLSPAETRHFHSIRSKKSRDSFLLGRVAAKAAICRHANIESARTVDIRHGAFEQPVVSCNAAHSTALTLSHTDSAALAVAHDADHPMGVDMETTTVDRPHLLRSNALRDSYLCAASPKIGPRDALFITWAAKEALSKALRCGLGCSFKVLGIERVEVDARGACVGEFTDFKQYQFVAWITGPFVIALVCSKRVAIREYLPRIAAYIERNQ